MVERCRFLCSVGGVSEGQLPSLGVPLLLLVGGVSKTRVSGGGGDGVISLTLFLACGLIVTVSSGGVGLVCLTLALGF